MSNPLSDIYAKQVLLNEAKTNVVTKKGEIDPSHKAKPTKGGPKGVKGVPAPKANAKFSGKGKLKESMHNTTNRSAFGGTFEKLFKATLIESDVAEDAASDLDAQDSTVPSTTPEDTNDEIHSTEDEVTDLADDLRAVISHLESILDRVGGVDQEAEETSDFASEEPSEEDSSGEFEESIGEAVSSPEPKALGDKSTALKSTKKFTASNVKPHGGKASTGSIEDAPEPKALGDKSNALQGAKKSNTVGSSNIKVGDFFK